MDNTDSLDIRDSDGGALLLVKVVPGSSRSGIVAVLGNSLKVSTSSPPEKGKANAAVAALLSEALHIDRRSVNLAAGQTSSRKTYRISGLGAEAIRQALSEI